MRPPDSPSSQPEPTIVRLRILETTDLHVQVWPHDYYTGLPSEGIGLARTASLIQSLRQAVPNCLLFDNGDFLQGNPMGDYIAHARGMHPGQLHPIIAAMNTLAYDAATLGNHEFNYGINFLMSALAGAAFPVTSSNVAHFGPSGPGPDPLADRTLLPPFLLLDRLVTDARGAAHPLRVGVIGFLPPQITVWDHKHLSGRYFTRDIVRAAEAWVPQMKRAGADIIVALAHSGIGDTTHVEGMENACIPLARVEGIDVLLAGHSHLLFPASDVRARPGVDAASGRISGKPAVMAGFCGSHVGVVDLKLERADGRWQIRASDSAVHPIASVASDGAVTPLVASTPRVLDAVAEDHRATETYMAQSVGENPLPLHSYFALAAEMPAVRLVAIAQQAHVRDALRGTPYEGLPVLSAAAPFKAGGRVGPMNYTDVPTGPLALRNIADLYIYPNQIRALIIRGTELAEWLERAAGLFNRVPPGSRDAPLLNPDFPSYNFDMVHGVTCRIDLSQPSRYDIGGALVSPDARRIRNLCLGGVPVRPDARFVLATNDYRAYGGGAFPGAGARNVIHEGQTTNRDVVLRYVKAFGIPVAPLPQGWTFAPLPGTTVTFESGPGAMAHLAEAAPLGIESAGPAPGGFVRFRLRL